MSTDKDKRKEIYTYTAPWLIYGMNWSWRADQRFRLAIGSFEEEYTNSVRIIQLDEETYQFVDCGGFDHPYPPTKIMWMPDPNGSSPRDLLATTGDYLRLWNVQPNKSVRLECLLNNNKNTEFCAPITSFDWNEVDSNIIGTSSIDTTCTIWDINKMQAKTQLIAHDKEVYDLAFAAGVNVFASVGADGSVRMFDLRSLEHSTIIYESNDGQGGSPVPLVRLAWNKQDPNYMATITMDSNKVVILDIRVPSLPAAKLEGHSQCVNALAWAPHSSCHICTAGDDNQALIWDLSHMPKPIEDPILAYYAEAEVNQLQWSKTQPDWVAIAFDKKLQILRV